MKNSICFVIPRYITAAAGGAELQVYFLAGAFIDSGWKVEILSRDTCLNERLLTNKYYNPSIRHHCYKATRVRFLEFFRVLIKLFGTESSYYYQRTDFALTGAVALYTRLSVSRKFIYATSLDDCVLKNRFSTVSYRKNSNPIKNHLHKVDMYLVDKMIESGKKKADLILCQTVFQQREMQKNMGLDSQLLRNSYQAFSNRVPKKKDDLILWISNLRPAKQPELFLTLVDKLDIPGWEIKMIGLAGPEYMQQIRAARNPGFEYLGALPLDQTENWIRRAKILVNTSKMEGFPNTFIQAWHFRTFVMSLEFDPDHILQKEKVGFFANGDLEALAEQLQYTASKGPDEETLVKSSRFAEKNFNLDKNIKRLIALMTRIQ